VSAASAALPTPIHVLAQQRVALARGGTDAQKEYAAGALRDLHL